MPQLDKFIFLNLIFWTIILYVFVEIFVYYELPRIGFSIKFRNKICTYIYDEIFFFAMDSFYRYAYIKSCTYYALSLMSTYINFNKKVIKKIIEK